MQHAITRLHPQPEELMDVEPAPAPLPARPHGPAAPAPGAPAADDAAEAALAGAASPPASQPPPAADTDTPPAAATPELPPAPHKGWAKGDSPSLRESSASPCVTAATARLSLASPGDKVCSIKNFNCT